MQTKAIIWSEAEASAYRDLMDMRGISVREVAAEMGRSPKSVHNLLGCIGREPGPSGRVRIRPSTLAALDSAIARLTDRKGGVFAACGSTPAGVVETARLLASA